MFAKLGRMGGENPLERCRAQQECPPAAQEFLRIIAEGCDRDGLARIGVINRAVNLAIMPIGDVKQLGVRDRWSYPLETLTTGRGDCEDYAIAKYVPLVDAGVPKEDVKLTFASCSASSGCNSRRETRLLDVALSSNGKKPPCARRRRSKFFHAKRLRGHNLGHLRPRPRPVGSEMATSSASATVAVRQLCSISSAARQCTE